MEFNAAVDPNSLRSSSSSNANDFDETCSEGFPQAAFEPNAVLRSSPWSSSVATKIESREAVLDNRAKSASGSHQAPVREAHESIKMKWDLGRPFPVALDPNLLLCEMSPYHVRLAAYAGPLDLLLDLIRTNEMDVYDIPVAEVTRQYLESLNAMKELDLEVAGEYLVMAATLLYIKSKMLLPIENPFEDDDEGDPRNELVQKLLEYQAFKEAARELGILAGERGKVFTRQISDYYLADLDPEDVVIDTFSANLYDLLSAFQTVLTKASREAIHEIFEEEISIEEKLEEFRELLNHRKKVYFSQLFKTSWTRNQLIVTFLALLEIVRTKFALVKQDESFGEIVLEKRETALMN